MPEITLELVLYVLCVGVFTAVAAVSDLRTRKIPNKLTVPVFFLGLLYQGVFHGTSGLLEAGHAFLFGFGILFVLWIIGGGGGGDVKLVGALSVWLGYELTIMVLMASTVFVILGSVLTMGWSFVSRGMQGTKTKYIKESEPTRKGEKPVGETAEKRSQRRVIAYALPVAVATWMLVILKLDSFPFWK